ncbi:PAS domain S-box/PAS domain S-box [Rheinheimera sp. A13L]|uniref:CHASE domain-containing protein n=1 Tax=Rheinheimera sp. A13L TaxID=506534 RepID=UPI00021250CB|nr:CHASE domain-containing protein [Rheinheimera sp. A13L]EGM78928.1 PAS domain S-box/PAS domain S-box [Rheinheimera sp. A13L]
MNKQAEALLKYRWSLLVFLVGITLSVLLGYQTQSNNMLRINQAMQGALDLVSEDILTKVKLYQYGLRGARGSVLTAGEHGISRALFYRYSLTRDVDLEFPGARGFGFIRRVPVSETPQFLANARADGWPEFSIRELSPNSKERYVIQYIEPVERNKAAVGLDIASEHNRYAAAKSAMLSGEVRLTGPITLVQASGLPAQSFLILMPLYRSVKTPETAAEREKQAFGWSYAPLIMTEVLAHVRVDANKFILSLDDVTETETPVRFFNNAVDATGLYPLNAVQTIYGRSWRFNMAAQPAFIHSMHLQSPVQLGLFGAMASLLLALLAGLVETNRRNRERLFAQQAKLVSLVESSADGIISCTLDGRVLSWNKGAESLFGYTSEEAINTELQSLIAQPLLANELSARLQRVAQGQSITNYHTVHKTKSGSLIDVSVTLSPIYAENDKVVAASKTVRDISAQKLAEAEVRELNTSLEAKVAQRTAEIASLNLLFKNVLASASDFAIMATDMQGTIQLFNRGAELLLGYSADEIMGQATPLLFHSAEELARRLGAVDEKHPLLSSPDFQSLIELSEHNEGFREWCYLHKEGLKIDVNLVITVMRDDKHQLVGYLFIATDITLQKQKQNQLISTQQQLSSQTEQLTLAYKVAELGIWEWRIADNSLVWNDKMFEFYEQPSALNHNGLNYSHWESRVHPDDRDATASLLQDAVAGTRDYNPIFRLQLPSGKVRYIQGGAYVQRDSQGAAIRVVGINRDITAERELELQLRESKYLADAANSAKSMFLANMSHEIRTPMNAVLGMLQLIKSTELSTQQHDYTSKAQIAARSLLNLINDILDYSKIEAGKLELEQQPFNTEALLRELDVVLSPSLGKKNIELLFDIDSALPTAVEGDSLRLQQVLINLSSNAIKFTTEGEVVLQLTLLQLQDKKARIRFSVRDTGIGISPSQQQRIFEGFTQAEASTTRQYGGTGLGLVISKRIVELMGGELQLQSEPGKGSCFWFDLEFNVATEVEAQRLITISSDTRVLIVDDNATALEILQKTVEQLGASVMLARSGEEALACVEHCFATNQTLHVVLMDYRMPGMNGLEVAQCIKAKSDASNLPVVIMVSAFGRDEIMKAQTTEVLPYAAYLTKPVTPQLVGALIEGSISGDILKPSARVRPEQSTSPLRGLRLLLVEDNEFNRVVASELLEHEGAVVDMAVGGQEGIDAIIKGNTSYDLVLMDVQMPVVDGLEATRQIRADKRFASLPIIAMTANVYTSDQEDCIKAGMNGHLAKPFDLDKVIETILLFTNKNLDKDTHLSLLSYESTEQPAHSARLSGEVAVSNDVENASLKASSETINLALPELQEIHFERKNLEVLLKPFGGKEAFFRRLIHVFEANFTSQLVSLQEKIKQNDHHEVLAILHAIKGTSGTIGLATVYQVICQLETQLKQYFNSEEFELSTLYSGLPERLDFIAQHELSDIHQLLAKKEAQTSEAVLSPAYNKDDLVQMLETLRPYLQAANLEALTLSQQLKEKLVGHEQLLSMTKDLFDTIEQLNFDLALLELNRLSK